MIKKAIFPVLLLAILSFSCKKEKDTPDEKEILYQTLMYVCDSMINNTNVPGLVAGVWVPDKNIEFVYTAGIASVETGQSMENNFHFRIGSNTKTVTITRFLQLVDSGYVSLQDTLNEFFPDFPKSEKITLEMLTDMTSGITSYTQIDAFQLEMYQDPGRIWTKDELIDFSRDEPFHFEPGEGIDYCNTNTQLIGRIIEMITNDDLANQIQKHIIEPLGLTNTYYLSSGKEMPDDHPKGYYAGSYEEGYPEYSEYYDISWAQAAGSMISTIYDIKEYVEALNSGFFLSDSLQQLRMAKKILFREPDVYYSIGAAWFGDYYGHDGGLPGFTSTMVHSNDKNCTIIVWFNCNLDNDDTHTDHIFNRFDSIIFD
ncbi:MAG: beta-lactamase family protein [Bacteroidales bacterium]|nr:beta-lactamase family protein [Bacteroidales bacterium]